MTKIAVISDIHGNLIALEKVIEDIKDFDIDKLFILGDLSMAGYEPDTTVTRIRELEKEFETTIIQGNTDVMVALGNRETGEFLPNHPVMKNVILYAQDVISKENKEFLANLPVQKSVTVGQVKILLTHGSPRHNDENIFSNESIETIKPMIENVDEDLILCGHTHLPAGYQIDNQTVVNVGSVGRPFTEDSKACWVLIEIPDENKKQFQIEHRFVPFDAELCAQKLSGLYFEGSKILAEMMKNTTGKFPKH